MRLFVLPDGHIDRKDRAQWITPPFDLQANNPGVTLPAVAGSRFLGYADAFGGIDPGKGKKA